MEKPCVRVVITGHVDHGKSTLVGRLLHDTGSLPEGRAEKLEEAARARGLSGIAWAFALDALQAERNQGVTIESAEARIRTPERDYVIVDAPGHGEFLQNMVSGASAADAGLVLIDASEGIREQTRRHGHLLKLLGMRQIGVVITKMDLVDYDAERFGALSRDYRAWLEKLELHADAFIPVSAEQGDNIVSSSSRMPWYDGPSVLDLLARFHAALPMVELPLRLPLQDVYKFDARRILAGRMETGMLRTGEELIFLPSGKTATVKTLEAWHSPAHEEAHAGQSIGITLEEAIFLERGEIAAHADTPPEVSDRLGARIFWLAENPLFAGDRCTLKAGTQKAEARVEKITQVIHPDTLAAYSGSSVARGEVAEIVFKSAAKLAFDAYADNPRTGRLVIAKDGQIAGGGMILAEHEARRGVKRATNITPVEESVTPEMREKRLGHAGGVVWLTGLSGAGKSTLAKEAEARLFGRGYFTFSLDGDNLRSGINADLGFAPEERTENVRRAAHIAALLERAGHVVLASFVSPYRADRAIARAAANRFHEVYVKADLAACEARDPKGLYKKARLGQIKDFTGISSPYEEPREAELVLDTVEETEEESVQTLVDYVTRHFPLFHARASRR